MENGIKMQEKEERKSLRASVLAQACKTYVRGLWCCLTCYIMAFGRREFLPTRTEFVVIVNSPLVGFMEEMVDTLNNSVAARNWVFALYTLTRWT
jgi:hypothetical protein